MLKRALVAVGMMIAMVTATAVPANAVTDGAPDNGEHPYVGLMVALDDKGEPLWRCSGTLLGPGLFLTAGHCTEAPATDVRIWFDENVDATGYPDDDYATTGTPITHPDYDPDAFYLFDLGVVVLDTPVQMDEYGVLPELGAIDDLATARGTKDVTFEAVGYGLQAVKPQLQEDRIRLKATLNLVSIRGTAGTPKNTNITLTGDAARGGTCFGDSGGPEFFDDSNVVAAVTSFGLNENCAGIGGGYRVDQPDDLDWLNSEFGELISGRS